VNLNRSGLATTGFNLTKDALIDKSKNGSSHKYGKTEIQTPHPAWVVKLDLSSLLNGKVPPKIPTLLPTVLSILHIDPPKSMNKQQK
jgi:hypothetical protein